MEGVTEGDCVLEGVPEGVAVGLGHTTTFALLPAPHPAGQVQATQLALEEAPLPALYVPGEHGVGALDPKGQNPPAVHSVPDAALAGQKDPAGHGTASRV